MQFKKHIKRTQERPGGIVDIEVITKLMGAPCSIVVQSAMICLLVAETYHLQQHCSSRPCDKGSLPVNLEIPGGWDQGVLLIIERHITRMLFQNMLAKHLSWTCIQHPAMIGVLQVRVTRGKLASGTAIARPAVLARRSRTRTYEGKLLSYST